MEPRPIQRDLYNDIIATEIIALSHHEEDDPFQARTASTIKKSLDGEIYCILCNMWQFTISPDKYFLRTNDIRQVYSNLTCIED